MRRVKILLIDDDEMNNYFMKRKIGEMGSGSACKAFTSGQLALEYLRKADRQQNGRNFPEVIFLDLQMPVMNGFEFLEQYEAAFFSQHPNTKVIAVSKVLRPAERSKMRNYKSVAYYISKESIVGVIKEVLEGGIRTTSQ